jgi:hypothetical protein
MAEFDGNRRISSCFGEELIVSDHSVVKSILILGGGSAGLLSAITLKGRLPSMPVTVLRSKDIGIIGVGEGTTVGVTSHLHSYLGIDAGDFFRHAKPIWKLGIRLIWGPRPHFDYAFAQRLDSKYPPLTKPAGDQFGVEGYLVLLVGQKVPYRKVFVPTESDLQTWAQLRRQIRDAADRAVGVAEAVQRLKSPTFCWKREWFSACATPASVMTAGA